MCVLVSKRPMTLEEKIARVQQKLREKAEQRKRQYDKEVKLRPGNKNAKLNAENCQDIIAKPNIDEIERQIISESVAESNLKAPVHHEHELRDALEVEIYHKSSNDLQTKERVIEDLKITENKKAKEIKETILDEFKVIEEHNDKNQATEEKSVSSNYSTMSETDEIRKNDGMGENENENSVHIQKPKSVEDFTVNHHEIEQREPLMVQTLSEDTLTPKLLAEKKDSFEDNFHNNFDYTHAVINKSVSIPERNYQELRNQNELETLGNVSEITHQNNETQNTILDEVTSDTKKRREDKDIKDPETNNTEPVNVVDAKESEENENRDVTLSEKIINTTTSEGNLTEECNVVKNTANENGSEKESKLEINANDKQHHENTSSTKVECGVDNYEPSDVIQIESEVLNETIMESKNLNEFRDENGTAEFSLNKDAEENNLQPFIDKEPEDTSDFVHTNISDGVISEHRVLVVELADVKDDNASVPEQSVENVDDNRDGSGRNLTDMPVDVTNEDSDRGISSASGADSEKPNTDQLSKDFEPTTHEQLKRNLENISEGIETTSNTTDMGKSDNETISLDKFSSTDDSAPEDGNDNVGHENKTTCKSTNYTHSAMDLETAAVTIQKVFRTFLFKSRASTFEDSVIDDNNLTDEDAEKVRILYN